jgi:hypothetical protein
MRHQPERFLRKTFRKALGVAYDAGDYVHWRTLPVVPRFRRPPEEFVPALATTWMTPGWIRYGVLGYNFWTMPLPTGPNESSGRYDPDHPLFQAWICIYLIGRPFGKHPPFGFTRNLKPIPEKFVALGRADQKAWLWLMGAGWAQSRASNESVGEPVKVGELTTILTRGRMVTCADVGYDNPPPSTLRLSFRAPHAKPAGLTQESFMPRQSQWRGKIRPYQEVEYNVEGFPLALPEYGLTAYVFYGGVKYERAGKVLDNLNVVRAAAAPMLEEGIEFVNPRAYTDPTAGIAKASIDPHGAQPASLAKQSSSQHSSVAAALPCN